MTLNTLIKKYGTIYDGLLVKTPQICAKMRIVAEKTTKTLKQGQ